MLSSRQRPKSKSRIKCGMGQRRSQLPLGELKCRARRIFRNKFYCGIPGFGVAVVCKEHAAVVGATQVPEKAELAIDDLTFPLFPGLSHSGSLAGPIVPKPALSSMLARG